MEKTNKSNHELYVTIKKFSEVRIEDRKSIFIGWASPISCVEDAKNIILKAKKSFCDANHVAYAWVFYGDQKQSKYSDDNEPQKTAGFPLLEILERNNLRNSIIIVIRYFGGTLLGTGGLVKNYTKAGSLALEKSGLQTYIDYFTCNCQIDYSYFDKICKFAEDNNYFMKNIIYEENINFKIYAPFEHKDSLIENLNNITNGDVLLQNFDSKTMPSNI